MARLAPCQALLHAASCVSYEYYVNATLEGKGGWDAVDVISNIQPTSQAQSFTATGALLAQLLWGFEHKGNLSWQEVLTAMKDKLGNWRFGVSGARNNCFTPDGNQCNGDGPADPTLTTYGQNESVTIPDEDPDGVFSTIEISNTGRIRDIWLNLDITHSFLGDLEIALEHNGITAVLWNQENVSGSTLVKRFPLNQFYAMDLSGTWTLHLIDHFGGDEGTLNHWNLVVRTQ